MNKIFIIAEAGVNHNGSIELAKKLIDEACNADCDCVKFQTFKSENVITKFAQKAEYQKKTTGTTESQLDMARKLELSFDDFKELQNYCKQKQIKFLSTPFDEESLHFLMSLGMDIIKIPSGEITNLPFLRKINAYKKEVILSTGMSTMQEIEDALFILKDSKLSLLHCTTEYPCPYEDVNLNAMQTMRKKFNLRVGYSDHTKGIEVAIAAVAMGATIIEKHFSLDKNMEGPDHKASIEPYELTYMVKAIRNIEKALGSFEKKPSPSEMKNIEIAQKSIVAKCAIRKGELFTDKNITCKRPGNGISPMQWDTIIGAVAQKEYAEDELI